MCLEPNLAIHFQERDVLGDGRGRYKAVPLDWRVRRDDRIPSQDLHRLFHRVEIGRRLLENVLEGPSRLVLQFCRVAKPFRHGVRDGKADIAVDGDRGVSSLDWEEKEQIHLIVGGSLSVIILENLGGLLNGRVAPAGQAYGRLRSSVYGSNCQVTWQKP
ncbi:hypothetical protein P8C59_006813 [Phyllachora maydis]|uniref:Uncharacterized protein n=1 Tax=Phyllachora maydis TaxID=1825666 RepID=A0AAD9I8B2_9PEZI|nr:hypothetical protein P8C59_006813 [Phyllachora maydis]